MSMVNRPSSIKVRFTVQVLRPCGEAEYGPSSDDDAGTFADREDGTSRFLA